MHGNTTRLICFRPSHLPPSEPNRAELFAGASLDLFQTGVYLPRMSLTSAQYCGFYYFGDKGADHCGKGDNRNPDGDKVPLETIEGATRGKVYLRDDSCPFNVSSFLDLYAHILERNSRSSFSRQLIPISSASHFYSSHPGILDP